jgi:pimeloyl-ACP methyl ester carboxylesterase
MLPEMKYAHSGDVNIVYEVIGDGPIDLVLVHGWVATIEGVRDAPGFAQFIQRLTSFSRVVQFDKRGTGMSDRVTQAATMEERMDDVRAVMDAIGSQRAAIMGISEGGVMAALFAATYPERTSALILYGAHAIATRTSVTEAELSEYFEHVKHNWGNEAEARDLLSWLTPSLAVDKRLIEWAQKFMRLGASPGAVIALERMNGEIDIRHILPSIRVPTLVLHRSGDAISVAHGRYLAQHISNAKYVELDGADHLPSVGNSDAILDEIEEFLTGVRQPIEHNRVLATIMFTDIVSSTERAHELGDHKWLELLDQHNTLVRKELARYRGVEVDTTGDGFFATFDGPARAIRCALAISDDVQRLGIQVRAGLHTGECELMANKVGGIAVHIGARVMAHSRANEVLVSSTVKDLVAGSGIKFVDRGVHELKGVPDEWHLYAAARGE